MHVFLSKQAYNDWFGYWKQQQDQLGYPRQGLVSKILIHRTWVELKFSSLIANYDLYDFNKYEVKNRSFLFICLFYQNQKKQEFVDIVETVYRGARKGRGLVVSPKDYSTKYQYWKIKRICRSYKNKTPLCFSEKVHEN